MANDRRFEEQPSKKSTNSDSHKIQGSSNYSIRPLKEICLDSKILPKELEKLLFAAVRRIAANRCFHGSPVFDSFYGDASTLRAGFC